MYLVYNLYNLVCRPFHQYNFPLYFFEKKCGNRNKKRMGMDVNHTTL